MKKYTIADLLQFCTFIFLTIDLPYLDRVIPLSSYIMLCGEILAVLFISIGLIQKRHFQNNPCMILLILFAGYYILDTLIHNGELVAAISIMLKVVIVAFVFYSASVSNRHKIIDRYIVYLTLIVFVDLLTEFAFPNGMYVSIYSQNWILGYKTNHLVYSLPLIVFLNMKMVRKRKFSLKYFLVLLIAALDMYRSEGTSGTVVLVLYELICVFILYCQYKNKKLPTFFHLFYSFYLAVLISLASFLLVVVNNNQTFLRFITSIFSSKSMTLSGRVKIWAGAISLIRQNMVWGLGRANSNFLMRNMNGFANAHNAILTYLLTGGLVGLFCIFLFHYMGYRRMRKTTDNLMISIAVYSILLLGTTSAVLSYSAFYLTFIIILADTRPDTALTMINERKRRRRDKKE